MLARYLIQFIKALVLLMLSAGALHSQTVAFTRDSDVWIADLSKDDPPRRLAPGTDAAISPDGAKVAFTHNHENGGRRIAVANVATSEFEVLEGIPGDNSYLPIWSPDGKFLFFNHFVEKDWAIARVAPDGKGFTILKDLPREPGSYAWSPNGVELLCHDLNSFFVLAFEGENVRLREIPASQPLMGLSTPSRLDVSPDGKLALFEMLVEDEMGPDDEGPPSSVYLLEMATGKIKRVTRKPENASYPTWLPNGTELLFSSYNPKTSAFTIYRGSIDGSKVEPVINNGSAPTAARSQ